MPVAQLPAVSLYYETHGDPTNPAVVLSNSIGTNADLWEPLVTQLVATHHVISFDARGHRNSSTPVGDYTLSALADDIVGLLDILGIARTSLVGLSIGGQIGLTFALEHPDRLDRLVVSNTGAKIGTAESWSDRAATVRGEGLGSIVDKVVAGWLTPGFAAVHPELHARMREWFLANDAEGYAATCYALAHGDLRDSLGRITAPTLVIGATGDLPTPPALTGQIAEAIPGAGFVAIPGAHLSVQESPNEYGRAVLAHLNS
ncbi:3-oxoadipate enol-lactonase [Brooklawnia cerclae]|uniref:3-oxoadipate enol-lactonase n=1 Tax=Brooklawnia cerclae TaxID=349934 RepID=A0ABX0SHS5_9ACTN|nr:3-oxoadipate enol-lactonase [Brooklawnia cerclae]NIH57964.1 3-oxoadipate enol-lactonase [Brooklawnia cerclae]